MGSAYSYWIGPNTNDPAIGAIEYGWVWIPKVGGALSLGYSDTIGGKYSTQIDQVMTYVDSVANAGLHRVANTSDADIVISLVQDPADPVSTTNVGVKSAPNPVSIAMSQLDLVKGFASTDFIQTSSSLRIGGEQDLLQQIGHALGLKNPSLKSTFNSMTLPSLTDNFDTTLMSSNFPPHYRFDGQYAPDDLAALADLYGQPAPSETTPTNPLSLFTPPVAASFPVFTVTSSSAGSARGILTG